tara:strand:+ start:733 stop:1401 length:669 start_codon:yes stop_codon:yes gene_type:complete
MKKVIIIGNSIAAEIIYGYLENDTRFEVVCFSVDKEYIKESHKFGLKVEDFDELVPLYPKEQFDVILGIGYNDVNQTRAHFFNKVKKVGYNVVTYIHPSAVVQNNAEIGEGSMILSNSVVEPFAKIGENSIVWSNCTIAHHSEIGSHCWIASNSIISGQAIVKDKVFIGVNCTVVNEVIVEELNIIGAGCLITKNTKPKEVFLTRNAEKHRFDSINYAKYFL